MEKLRTTMAWLFGITVAFLVLYLSVTLTHIMRIRLPDDSFLSYLQSY